uniref:Uncharacterized protein n=1 Tax=Setaria viridis TaxID=4556 RepID=A0A4U6UTA8_SETVI|nr:uncharacterized protein LOC117857920 [Setaria viridis]TKW18972.1 hypothetical protein SEVIR_5G467900v2 [Setaria viridis]
MASMDCALHVLLRVMMRRSICRLQEVVDMAVDIGTALFVAVRVSGLVSRRRLPSSSSRAPSISASTTTTYYYSPPAAASLIGMSRIDRH